VLSGSGDPAAACCSTITELGNPEINLFVCGARTLLYDRRSGAGGGPTRLEAAVCTAATEDRGVAAPAVGPTGRGCRSVAAEGLHRLLGRHGLSAPQRSTLLALLGQPQPPPPAAAGDEAAARYTDAALQQSEAGLEVGRLLAEHAALTVLSNHPPSAADATQFAVVLGALEDGATVAVLSLLGSLNPVTLGHVQCFDEARKILLGSNGEEDDQSSLRHRPARLEGFDGCLGLLELNSDQRVGKKMAEAGDVLIPQTQRSELVQLSTADKPWLGCGWPQFMDDLQVGWPNLNFVHFEVNGADDVVKYGKFWSQPSARMIVMGRPGSTEAVRAGMADAHDRLGRPCPIDGDDPNFVMGPELPDISSSAARRATRAGDGETLSQLVHPAVSAWLLQQPWAGETVGAVVAAAAGNDPSGGWSEFHDQLRARLAAPDGCEVTADDVTACAAEVEALSKRLLVTVARKKLVRCRLTHGVRPLSSY
jgi:hypothetical protein